MEIDLHDKNVNEAINYFMTKYNEILSKGFKGEISVIHGYGSSGVGGKIKKRFKEFSEAYTSYFNVSYNNNMVCGNDSCKKPLFDTKGTLFVSLIFNDI